MTETVKKIKNITEIYGWTQKELSERSGVDKSVINRAFNDKCDPSIAKVEKLVDALEMKLRLHKE